MVSLEKLGKAAGLKKKEIKFIKALGKQTASDLKTLGRGARSVRNSVKESQDKIQRIREKRAFNRSESKRLEALEEKELASLNRKVRSPQGRKELESLEAMEERAFKEKQKSTGF